ARALQGIAAERGQSLAQLALAWALRDSRVTSVLLGASSVDQLADNLATLDRLELSAAEITEIEPHAVDGGIKLWARSSQGWARPCLARWRLEGSCRSAATAQH